MMFLRIVHQFLSPFGRCFHRIVTFPSLPILKLYLLRRKTGIASTRFFVILTRLLIRFLTIRRMLRKKIYLSIMCKMQLYVHTYNHVNAMLT